MQNLMISAYGANLRRRRYGGEQRRNLAAIREAPWIPASDQARQQLARLNDLLQHARSQVPFYARRIPRSALTSLDELRILPLLSKRDVIDADRRMLARDDARRSLLSIHTGGTTGTPLTVHCSRGTLRRNYAFFARFLESAGLPELSRVATFAGRVLVPAGHDEAPYWRFNLPGHAMLCSSYHIGPATLALYADALAAYRPTFIDAYPSSIAPIARHLLRTGDSRIRPRAVITSSETLSTEDHAAIAAAFGCPVFDHYGSAEMVALITQCREGVYHANSDYGVLELLDGTRPVEVGEEGSIVATGFINPVMPLIRYVTGDRAVRGPDAACACGSSFPRIAGVLGRADDVLVTPEGHHVGRLDPIFKTVGTLDATRIVQDAADHIRVEMVSARDLSAPELQSLREQLRHRLGPTMKIDFRRVPQLERTIGGKLRSVVNLTAARSGDHPSTPTVESANPG
jgi:phenylacetate-CoA ligase